MLNNKYIKQKRRVAIYIILLLLPYFTYAQCFNSSDLIYNFNGPDTSYYDYPHAPLPINLNFLNVYTGQAFPDTNLIYVQNQIYNNPYFKLVQPMVVGCTYEVKYTILTPWINPSNPYPSSSSESDFFIYSPIDGRFADTSLLRRWIGIVDSLNVPSIPRDTIYNGYIQGAYQIDNPHTINTFDTAYHVIDTFIADGAYQIFELGCFEPFENIVKTGYYNHQAVDSFIKWGSFGMENISVIPIHFNGLNLCIADTNLCNSNSININAYQPEFTHYEWSTGDTTANIQINNGGKYWLTAHYACGYLSDTFYVAPSIPNSLLPYQDTITICPSQLPYTLQADSLPNYLWNTGDATRQIIAQSSGLYTIESAFYCGIVRDSVYIKIKEKEAKNLIAFTDTLICAKALPFALEVIDTFQNYVWSNGATTAQNTFDQADEYFVEVSDGCHTYQDTFRLQTEDLDTGVFVQQHFYCPQDFPINIDGFTFSVAKDTIFSQTQSNTCGSRTDSILLFVLPNILQEKPSINIIDSCKQLGYYLINVLAKDTNFSYQWENGNPLQFTTKGGETQQLIVSNACSTFKIDTFIAKCPEQIIFALPTAFSPNNDGVNDAFRLLYLNPDYELIDLSIFNRWGSQIFSTDQLKTAWQGKFQNENCPIDEYVYQLKLRHKTTSAVEVFSGSVLLVF